MNLVLQGPSISKADVDAIADGARPSSVEGISSRAFRLKGASPHDSVAKLCEARRIDFAWVPEGRRFADLKLLAMDMDSTLITIECIDEIADFKGIKPEVAAITASAMRGEIDFAQSLTRRVALLAGLPVADLAAVYDERLRISPGATRMLGGFKAVGAITALVSGGFTFFTDRLKTRLGLDVTLSNTFEVSDNRLTGRIAGDIVDAEVKAATVRDLKARHGGLTVTLGDGANDLPMFAEADVSIAYRAKPVVRAAATHALDFCGLDGALNLFR
jgi:phosphoserine phosphatase